MAQLLGFEKTRTILRLLSNFGTLRIVIFLYVFFLNMDICNYLLIVIRKDFPPQKSLTLFVENDTCISGPQKYSVH